MTSIAARRPDALGVHSLHRFAFTVPDLDEATRFFEAFGLAPRRVGNRLDLYAVGHPHCWGSLYEAPGRKKLQYLSFGCYEDDLPALSERLRALGIERIAAPQIAHERGGVWIRHSDGFPIQIIPAPKTSPDSKAAAPAAAASRPGFGRAPSRSQVTKVQPRRLSHVLLFSPEPDRAIRFYADALGLRLSDRSADIVAFLHGPHGSDHHMVAMAKSDAPGLHHSSWDVASIDEVGLGMEQMLRAGYPRGWGVGRHVLGSNYFYYARDPWGSYAEYSYDIDHIPADVTWNGGDHPPDDSFYVWGPAVPEDFVLNHESEAAAAPQHAA